ncbi:MAG: HAMP domain-containing sensor histidine kinase [Gemmatimonadales bacterium]
MQSIRRRLTISYTIALTASIVVFGAALYWERRQASIREAEQQLEVRLTEESRFAIRWLRDQARQGKVVVPLPNLGQRDSTFELVSDARTLFEGMRDYLFVADDVGRLVYVSPPARDLTPSALVEVRRIVLRQPVIERRGQLELIPDQSMFRFLLQPADSISGELGSILIAAQPTTELNGPAQLLVSMILVAPLILVASTMLGYWLAGRSLRPVDTMVEELEAVQDGRSLHRRLAVPTGEDELTRLAQKLNAMLSRVEQSFNALRRFTADASHELKTPLMVLRAGVERSLTDPRTPQELVGSLDETLRQINQMSELVTNLLTLARADEGRSGLVLVEADFGALVRDSLETADLLGADQGVEVEHELPEEAVLVPVDPPRIRQLLMNLVTNAVKYTPANGKVSIRLTSTPDAAVLTVADTGIGIAPGDLENVFERFWRADPARSRTGERPGTGLGLAISKWIAEAHGGTIEVQSRPGRGSIFTVTLPRGAHLPATDVSSL